MPIQINSPGWRVKRVAGSRGAARAAIDLPGVPPELLTALSVNAEEVVLVSASSPDAQDGAPSLVDISCDERPGQKAILAIRLPSGALTLHLPVESTARDTRGKSHLRFRVTVRRTAQGDSDQAIRVMVIMVPQVTPDDGAGFVLPKLTKTLEKTEWRKRGLKEGWLKVSKQTLGKGRLASGKPVSPARSLLFIHGPFSDTTSTFRALAGSDFFDHVKNIYADRVFAFDHFTLSRTPDQNARMLLEALPEQTTTFDVITHSRGGLVLRHLVEHSHQFGDLARRFNLGRAVLVASPNDGTPLATPKRFDDTVNWIANLLEMFPDNPFSTGAALVANGLVWLANHASGDIPGLRAMGEGRDMVAGRPRSSDPPDAEYSALVANYHPTGVVLQRLLDIGIDRVFGSANDLVVPTEGGWLINRSGPNRSTPFIPASRIGCFGPGGNLAPDSVTHVNFFSQSATAEFFANALLGRRQPLNGVDPRTHLPDRRLLRGAMTDAPMTHIPPDAVAATYSRLGKSVDEAPLRITVTNGDLTFEPEALLLGHYGAMRLTGTEGIVNGLIGGAMEQSLKAGIYPLAVGSNQIFINTRPNLERGTFIPRPKAAIVVGLGEEGKLRASDLVQTVRQGVIAWAQRLAENKAQGPHFELATTLIGSGGSGVSASDAARLVAQGAYDANEHLNTGRIGEGKWPQVSHLQFIELYLDRATDAWRALRMQAAATPGRYLIDDAVQPGTGSLGRPLDSGYRGAEFDVISVEATRDGDGTPTISYTLDTRRAVSEVRGRRAQSHLLTELVSTASNDQSRDQQIGRTLFNLLVPVELEPYMAGSGELQIELDPQTATIPWELLDTKSEGDNELPWAIRVKLLRKLRIRAFRDRVSDPSPKASALVIGEPACPPEYPRLLGARSEALAVRDCLTGDAALDVTDLISEDPSQAGASAREVANALFEKPWRIVHIAGHGMPGASGVPGGVVLSNGTFLGPDEFSNMRTVPELVFVNCCHLGSNEASQLLNTRYDRAQFAAGVASALIAIGVRCVVAAGWAVDDDAATVFAEAFYRSLLRGNRFIVAVSEARAEARDRSPHLNTWAAYQCYGDPNWLFRGHASDFNQTTVPLVEDFAGIGSATALKLALRHSVVRTKYQGAEVAEQLRDLTTLEKLFGSRWGGSGDVAELFGEALVEAGDLETGMQWYETAVAAPDGTASMKAVEQLAIVRTRLGWEYVDRARLDDEHSLTKAIERAEGLISHALALLTTLQSVHPTMERHCLMGAAHKRSALIEGIAGRTALERQAIVKMYEHYKRAEEDARKQGLDYLPYPSLNRMAGELIINAARRTRWNGFDPLDLAAVRKGLTNCTPDFWSIVGQIELRLYEAAARGDLERQRSSIEGEFEALRARVSAIRLWRSVYEQAMFVLPNYAKSSSPSERKAATALLEKVATLAQEERLPATVGVAAHSVFISSSSVDKDLAARIATELEHLGCSVSTSLKDADACVVIISKSTGRPTKALSREWSAILERTWSEGSFRLFSAKRVSKAIAPAFLQAAKSINLQSSSGDLSRMAQEMAGRIHSTLAHEQA